MTAVQPIESDAVQPIPGLELDDNRLRPQTALEREALAHVEALNAAGRLNTGHRLLVALILDLARTVGLGAVYGKAAGVAMASKQLLDAMDKLPPYEDPAAGDDWADVVRALSAGEVGDDLEASA